MKIILTVLCVVALLSLANTSHVTWGKKGILDYPLSTETVLADPILNNYHDVNVVFPKVGFQSRNISAIYVYDHFTNSSGATPMLTSGGVGFTHAIIIFRSQWNMGVNSNIEYWGH